MNNHSKRHNVGVAGFRGYSGAELVRILARHPGVEVFLLEHRSDSEQRLAPLGQKPPKIIPATPEANQNRLGIVGAILSGDGDFAGYPNGRRPKDDVVDISLGAVFGNTLATLHLQPEDNEEDTCLTSDNVGIAASQLPTNAFPYLHGPH